MSRLGNHDIVAEELERHLEGNASRAFYNHLAECPECASTVASFDEVSLAMRELRSEPLEIPEVPLGFYNRIASQIVESERKDVWHGLFSPGEAFFRRIAFASLLLLAGLGTILATHSQVDSGRDAASIIAQHDPIAAHGESADRDRLLVTLTSYSQ